jgi:hypothetical protein
VALVLFDASICANDHIICGWLLILLMDTGDPLMPANPLGMGLGQILDPSRVVGLFAGIIYIRGHGFGMAKPSGFEPIAIPSFGNLLTNYSRLHPVTLKHTTLNTTLTYSSNVLDLHMQITSMRIAERRN